MKVTLKELLLQAFEHWDCPIREESRNLFQVEIEAGSIAADVCEATGTVYIGIIEFEDDVMAAYESWRSFTPGSYYLHRLLERLSEGPVTGRTFVHPRYRSPSMAQLFPVKQFGPAQCRLGDPLEQTELCVAATTFHFAVSLLGLEPITELVSLTVEPLHMNLLLEPKSFGFSREKVELNGGLSIAETFPAAAAGLKEKINELLDEYKKKRAGITTRAIRALRAAKQADLASLPRAGNDLELSRKSAEVEEIWTIREQDARIRGEAERVDVALVAATVQERPMTLYRAVLVLPGDRKRTLERLYDRATGWREPWRCEVCRQIADAFIPGDGPCQHLLCGDCAFHAGGCQHAFCAGCAVRCAQCEAFVCLVCESGCTGCGKVLCKAHDTTCALCSRRICNTCSQPCPSCARRLCHAHGLVCPVCGQITCPLHRRHKAEFGVYRISMTTFNRLSAENVVLDERVLAYYFKGRKRFLEALRTLLDEETYQQYKSFIVKDAEKCQDIWLESYFEDLVEHLCEHDDFETAFSPEQWQLPFDLSPDELFWVRRHLYREEWISLDDYEWWLRRSPYWADPFLNEYGLLPSEDAIDASLERLDSEDVLRLGWFEQEPHSDPTCDTVPFYDPGALDELVDFGLKELK